MQIRNHSRLGYFVLFLLVVPITPATSRASDSAKPSDTGSIPASLFADDLDASQRQTFESFAGRLEAYRRQLKIPGMSAAVIRNGQLVWAEGFGFADVENRINATSRTPYHLASLTRTFASQIIMKLVEDGKIDRDDPVKQYGVRRGKRS